MPSLRASASRLGGLFPRASVRRWDGPRLRAAVRLLCLRASGRLFGGVGWGAAAWKVPPNLTYQRIFVTIQSAPINWNLSGSQTNLVGAPFQRPPPTKRIVLPGGRRNAAPTGERETPRQIPVYRQNRIITISFIFRRCFPFFLPFGTICPVTEKRV